MGLICMVWFLLMGISGVLINHPALIRGVSVPAAFVPAGFQYRDWNRMAMKELVYSEQEADTLFTAGRMGVWQSKDGGRTFASMEKGYPSSAFDRDTNCLLLTRRNGKETLYAGNPAGLFMWDFQTQGWKKINHRDLNLMGVKDIVLAQGHPLVFTPRGCFRIEGSEQEPTLSSMPLRFDTLPLQTISMVRFMLRIHDGSILGFSGQLFVDALGVVLIFLSLSAIWLWYLPWRRKRLYKRPIDAYLYRLMHKYHLKIGIYSLFFLAVIVLTGMIIRPPFRQGIVNNTVPSSWVKFDESSANRYPGIRRVLYLAKENRLLLGTRMGFFMGPADFSQSFTLTPMAVPVSGMGVNVMERLSRDKLLIGSFDGLYIRDLVSGSVTDVMAENEARALSLKKHSKNRAVGAAVQNGTLRFWVDYQRGLIPVDLRDVSPIMPEALGHNTRMSLWRYLRAIHTGHLFKDFFGRYTWLLIPAGGMLLLISLLSGGYDWLRRRGYLKHLKTSPFMLHGNTASGKAGSK
jgi:hypothetical protein